jgi:hypothetical protein
MGFLDIVKSRILLDYKVELDQAKREVKEFAGVQKKAAQDAIDAMERQKQAHEMLVTKIAGGVFAIMGAYDIAKRGVEAYEKSLEAAGEKGAASLARLKAATAQASKAYDELQIAIGRVVIAAAPVIQQFADMATQLSNIAVGISRIVEAASHIPGSGIVGTVAKNAWRALPQGQILSAVEYGGDWLFPGGGGGPDQAAMAAGAARQAGYDANLGSGSDYVYIDPAVRQSALFDLQNIQARVDSTIRKANKAARRARRGRPGRAAAPGIDVGALGQTALDFIGSGYDAVNQGLEDFGQIGTEWHPDEMSVMADRAKAAAADLQQFMQQLEAEQQESMLTRIFGPVEEFDEYAAGFDLVKTSSQAAFQAWIDGSESVGGAAKKAAVQALTAQAVQLLGEGLASLGRGAIHLANPLTAATGAGELAAGAKAIGQAALIGSLAKGLGGGSSVGASGASAGGSASASGFGGGAPLGPTEGRNITIVHGDGQADDSPRWRARRVDRDLALYSRHYALPDGSSQG